MVSRSTITFILIAGTFALSAYPIRWVGASARAQSASDAHGASGKLPAGLRPSLDDGLRRFTQAQAAGDWGAVEKLLGRYYHDMSQRTLYKSAYKECLISHMQTSPLVSLALERIEFSTAILSTPAGRRWWSLIGTGEFFDPSGIAKHRTMIIAYRDRGGWYFTPLGYNYSSCAAPQ
jgi:hypothetical protein